MTVKEAWNRGNNLLGAGVVSLAGIAFLPEAFIEDKARYKIDDSLLFVLGLVAMWWYRRGNNKYTHSIAPIIFVLLGLAIKIMGIVIEIKEKDDVGDDFGGLVLFVAATILVALVYKKAKEIKN